ncbi:MAG TPA: hypothetical protein PK580_03545 [Nitrosomonas halophila]|nr:hypothetical protein [Nitrosomonas halophila]
MARFILEHWQPRLRWYIARLGNLGKIGIGLFVLALILLLAAVAPQRQALQQLIAKVETMQRIQTGVAGPIKLDDNQALQAFYDFFPRSDSSPYWVSELDKIAKQRGVELSSSDYRLVAEQNSKLARYEIQLPLQGSYPQIRGFIADALRAIPALALVDVAFKREAIQAGRLDVRLGMHLYLNVD